MALPEKKIVLTATMSAGKSTLVNALVGRELSFAKKAACTSTILRFASAPVTHSRYHVQYDQKYQLNLTSEQVREALRSQKDPCTVIGHFYSGLSRQRILLTDTPGVDSARNREHKKITREALKNDPYDLILYMIPVENYGSDDDDSHLKFIRKYAPDKKILFIVNMMDTCDAEDDSVEEILGNIADYLRHLGFADPVICPVSAKAGFLCGAALTGGKLSGSSEKDLEDFCAKFRRPEYDMSQYYADGSVDDMPCDIFSQKQHPEWGEIYRRTGIPGLKAAILDALKEE